MKAPSKRQKEILDFIQDFVARNEYAPSYREIADHFGLSSAATVAQHVNALQEKGYLEKEWNGSRSLELSSAAKRRRKPVGTLIELPLHGYVAAGAPIEAVEGHETVEVPEALLGSGEHYALTVQGDSMVEDAILDGDTLIVRAKETAQPGQTVVALIDGAEATVKRFRPEAKGWVSLEPANEKYKPLRVRGDRVRIRGVVVGVLRHYDWH